MNAVTVQICGVYIRDENAANDHLSKLRVHSTTTFSNQKQLTWVNIEVGSSKDDFLVTTYENLRCKYHPFGG